MSFAGFKKQFNKANQMFTEKIGGAKGTELTGEFLEMERKVNISSRLIEDMVSRTQEFLQPNPASRAKMTTMKTLNKLQGKSENMSYPQPEGQLGDCMIKHGKDLGDESDFGVALCETGDSFKQLADIKYALEDNVKQNFLDPLQNTILPELKEINHHRKKMQSRRLDYDCKKRKAEKEGPSELPSRLSEEECQAAEEKFHESKDLAETAMKNFFDSDVEHIRALSEFIRCERDYHKEAVEIMDNLYSQLQERVSQSGSNKRNSAKLNHKTRRESSSSASADAASNSSPKFVVKTKHEGNSTHQIACCRALYDFVADNSSELNFEEGDTIKLIQQVDENWFFGEIKGRQGHFPVNYVEVLVPLPE